MEREEVDWRDRAERKTFPVDTNTGEMELHLGNCAIALFRHRSNMDYLAIRHEEDESWTFCFDRHDLIYWMGGIALSATDRENIRRAESKLGTFYSRYGWNPDLVIEDYPSKNELEVYINYITDRDVDTDGQLRFPEEV